MEQFSDILRAMRQSAWLFIGILTVSSMTDGQALPRSPKTPAPPKEAAYFLQTGRASYYGEKHDGRMTASGSHFSQQDLTAAHPWLPFGTVVRVTNLANGRMVKVTVTDRGPHAKSRAIDVSAAAARAMGMWRRGLARVSVKAFQSDQGAR